MAPSVPRARRTRQSFGCAETWRSALLRIHFTGDDLLQISMNPHPAPLVELKVSLMMLQRPRRPGALRPLAGGASSAGRCPRPPARCGTWSPPTALRRSSTRSARPCRRDWARFAPPLPLSCAPGSSESTRTAAAPSRRGCATCSAATRGHLPYSTARCTTPSPRHCSEAGRRYKACTGRRSRATRSPPPSQGSAARLSTWYPAAGSSQAPGNSARTTTATSAWAGVA